MQKLTNDVPEYVFSAVFEVNAKDELRTAYKIMTLSIFVRSRESETASSDSNWEMWNAGFEHDRTQLWGNQHLKELGLRFLPSIETDLAVPSGEFSNLLIDCEKVEGRIDLANARNGKEDKWWRSIGPRLQGYIANIRQAVEYARDQAADEISIN